MKRFMYFGIGVLCLALSALMGSHIGSQSAIAQTPPSVVGVFELVNFGHHVMLENGDVYFRPHPNNALGYGMVAYDPAQPAEFVGNFWANGPVSAEPQSLGDLKAKYK